MGHLHIIESELRRLLADGDADNLDSLRDQSD